jgi:hypothetical protein
MLPGRVPPAFGKDAIERAREDLAERLGLDAADVVLVMVIDDDFPGGDLGCPSPKEPAPSNPSFVTGREIVLKARGEQYFYRAHGGLLVFCGAR